MAGMTSLDWTWAVRLVDLDNDGLLDVFVTNGHARIDEQAVLHIFLDRGGPPSIVLMNRGGVLERPPIDNTLKQWRSSYQPVWHDIDQDGRLDMGVNSAQRPRFRILQNAIVDTPNQSAFVNWVGGHQGTDSQTEWSSRDPHGAPLLVKMGKTRRAFQLSCGEGLSSQNSKWIHIGMGQADKIDRIDVTWPSGKQTTRLNVAAGERVTLFENPDEDPADAKRE